MGINLVKEFFGLEDVSGKIALVFHMKSCLPSQVLKNWVKEVALEQKIYFLDCDCADGTKENFALSNGIRDLPTLIFFEDGEETERVTGLITQRALYKVLALK